MNLIEVDRLTRVYRDALVLSKGRVFYQGRLDELKKLGPQGEYAKYPISIYPSWIQALLLSVIPFASSVTCRH